MHPFFLIPGPPNLGLSRQGIHLPQSSSLHVSHFPQRFGLGGENFPEVFFGPKSKTVGTAPIQLKFLVMSIIHNILLIQNCTEDPSKKQFEFNHQGLTCLWSAPIKSKLKQA